MILGTVPRGRTEEEFYGERLAVGWLRLEEKLVLVRGVRSGSASEIIEWQHLEFPPS